ncbi:MAG: SigB/SigF/SigG family RNA polymerase sigma factor [Clostridia bacterium]|jgi:RNA polymerase sporulation-specific sigma factor|nr:SigB/SigF/SigG family RNA polymerase sigma factor [Clostridiaceae bacterium]
MKQSDVCQSQKDQKNVALIIQAQKGDESAKDALFDLNAGLIWSVVRKFANRGYELEDLFQIGCIGFLKAIEKFDTGYDVCFSTYAVPMIMGEIRRFLRDDGIIRVSRSMKEAYSKIRAAREILLKQNGEEPTIAEIASFTGLSDEEIVTAMEANASPESLYADNNEQDKSDGRQLIDKLGNDEPEEEKLLNNIVLREVLKTLNKRDKKIIDLRYFEHKTQVETAQILGISQVQISRLEKRILSELKGRIG